MTLNFEISSVWKFISSQHVVDQNLYKHPDSWRGYVKFKWFFHVCLIMNTYYDFLGVFYILLFLKRMLENCKLLLLQYIWVIDSNYPPSSNYHPLFFDDFSWRELKKISTIFFAPKLILRIWVWNFLPYSLF